MKLHCGHWSLVIGQAGVAWLLVAATSAPGWVEPARPVTVARDGQQAMTLVYGRGLEGQAQRLAAALTATSGVPFRVVADAAVLKPDCWQLADEWLQRPLILVGSIYDNGVLLSLAGRRMVACNSEYPGPGNYEVRALFAPLRRGVDVIVIGAADTNGVAAGIDRLIGLLKWDGAAKALTVPAVLERGNAAGPFAPPAGPRTWNSFGAVVSDFVWSGSTNAAENARLQIEKELQSASEDSGLWGFRKTGHYDWESVYVPLRQLAASGFLPESTLLRLNERLVAIAVSNQDGYGQSVLDPKLDVDACDWRFNRHALASLNSMYVLHDYLANAAALPAGVSPAARDSLARNYETLAGHIRAIIRDGKYVLWAHGAEGMDNLSLFADLYWLTGDRTALGRKIYENMAAMYYACSDNAGSAAGMDAYIDSRPGTQDNPQGGGAGALAAAFFLNDPQCAWLRTYAFCRVGTMPGPIPPGMFAPRPDLKPELPRDYLGLSLVPLSPQAYRSYTEVPAGEDCVPLKGPPALWFSKAAFREGFSPDYAYLLMQGENYSRPDQHGAGIQGNAIVRYTELGSLLLFQNTQMESSWFRSVVSISRGHDDPQSGASSVQAAFKTPRVSGVSAAMEDNGGARWTRHVLRRAGAYFAVLDEMTAKAQDHYGFVCRWRSFHDGRADDRGRFTAEDRNGVKLHIVQPDPVPTTVTLEARDGAAEPTVIREFKDADLTPGGTVTFQNVLYAEGPAAPRAFEARAMSDRAFLVRGKSETHGGVDAIGVGALNLPGVSVTGTLWFVSDDQVVIAGCRHFEVEGCFRLTFSLPVNLALSADLPGSWIESPAGQRAVVDYTFPAGSAGGGVGSVLLLRDKGAAGLPAGAAPLALPGGSAALTRVTHGLLQAWAAAPERSAARASFSPAVSGAGALKEARTLGRFDFMRRLHLDLKARGIPPAEAECYWADRHLTTGWGYGSWSNGEGVVDIDLGKPVAIAAVRLIWPCVAEMQRRNEGAVMPPADVAASVTVSDDGFQADARAVPDVRPRVVTTFVENAAYMYTRRFPTLELPLHVRARHVRVKVAPADPARRAKFVMDEVQIVTEAPRERAFLKMASVAGAASNDVNLAVWSPLELRLLNVRGGAGRSIPLEAPLADLKFCDINSDGRREIAIFPLTEQFTVLNADGTDRYQLDLYAQFDGPARGQTALRPGGMAAWRPDKAGNLEFAFFPHVRYGRIEPEPSLRFSSANNNAGGKAAFTIPDITGDGREDLAIVGTYAQAMDVVASDSDLDKMNGSDAAAWPGRVVCSRPLTWSSSGNNEMPLYFDGAVVRATGGTNWLGVVAVNPGGVNYFAAPGLEPKWGHFNHAPNTCFRLWDAAGRGAPDVLLGREDGYVTRYRLEGGAREKAVFVGPQVRALDVWGDFLIAGGQGGLTLLDRNLALVDHVARPVDALAVVDDLAVVAFSDGNVVAYRHP